jgi:hypothetical protein
MTDPTPAEMDLERLGRETASVFELLPWRVVPSRIYGPGYIDVVDKSGKQVLTSKKGDPVLAFIVSCVNAQPALLSRLRAADQRAAELAAQNASLRAAGEQALSALDRLMGDSDLPDDDSPEMQACQALSTALRTTPAEALAVVREHVAASEEALAILDQSYPSGGVTITGIRKRAREAIDAARRIFGPAARGEAG